MLKRISQNIFLLISLTISLVVTGILWLIGQNNVSTVTLGIVIIVLGIVLDTFTRLNEQEEKIATLFGLHQELHKDPWLETIMQRILNNYHLSKSWTSALMINRARHIIEDLSESMHNLARGYFLLGYEEEIQIERDMLISAKNTFKAAAYLADPAVYKWWHSQSASKYLDAHTESIKSGIKVERIFMVQYGRTLLDLQDLIKRQIDIGIVVWVVWTEALSSTHLEDFIVVDDSSFIVSHPIEGRSKNALYSVEPSRVKSYVDKFNQIRLEAKLATEINWSKNQQDLQKDLGTLKK